MLINELPDDCLLNIFDYIQDLEDLINCFKVCEKWSTLIVDRTKNVKYFIEQPNYSPDSVCYQSDEPFDVTFLCKWFPNLRIVDFCTCNGIMSTADTAKLIRDSESLKGTIVDDFFFWVYTAELERIMMNANLEMLSTEHLYFDRSEINENVKQLYLPNRIFLPKDVAHIFPNLERLHIRCLASSGDDYSNGPVMANLKIIELRLSSNDWEDSCRIFEVMDSCPVLQSAHVIHSNDDFKIDDSIQNANLQDLVIQFYEPIKWNNLPRCISKYPNLKHLSLRNFSLKDEDIKQLILILPKLTLLDIRESFGVTQEAADHVQDYCKRYGRSIKFYFKKDDKQIEVDWPQILNRPEKICRGFDFMEHCFFKHFNQLPHFLDPIYD
uniref:F-box domain-containing protein n=1 Tax=Tetranychus urticae TaxID=32264 RepID=T1K4E1_TETUR